MMRKDLLNNRKKIVIAAIAAVVVLALLFVALSWIRSSGSENAAQRRANTLTLVRTYVDKEEFDRALALLETLLIENPEDTEASELLDIVLAAKRARERMDAGESVDRRELEEALAAARAAAARIASAADEAWRAASRMNDESERNARSESARVADRSSPDQAPAETGESLSDQEARERMEKENSEREEAERKALEESLANKNKQLQKQIEDVNRNVARGKQAAESGSFRSAQDYFNRAEADLPEGEDKFNASKYLEMAESLYTIATETDDSTIKTESLSSALEYVNKAIQADPSSAKAHWLRAKIYEEQGKLAQAEAELAEAVRLDLRNYLYVYELGRKQFMRGDFTGARTSFETATRLAPSFEPAFFNLGLTNRRLNKTDAALSAFRGATRIKADYTRAYIEIARLLTAKGDTDGAILNYTTALKHEPANVQALREMAAAYSTRCDYQSAERYFREALTIGSDDGRTNYNMATVQLELGNNAQALDYAKKAVAAEPRNAVFLYTYGLAGERNKMSDVAVQQYARAIAADPKYVKPRINLGIMYLEANRIEDALNQFTAAFTVESDNYEVNNNLGKVYGLRKEYNKAVEHFARAVSKNPKDPTIVENLATAYTSAGLLEKAAETYADLVKMAPSNWDARYELGKLYIQLERKTDAKKILEDLIRTKSDYEKAAEVKRLINTL